MLAAFLGEAEKGAHELAAQLLAVAVGAPRGSTAPDFVDNWEKWLADGVVPDTAASSPRPTSPIDGAALARAVAPLLARKADGGNGMEIAFAADPKVYDGRFANNVWLQELPRPDHQAHLGQRALHRPATAAALGVVTGDVVEITYRRRHARGAGDESSRATPTTRSTLPLGYGRTRRRAGRQRRRLRRLPAADQRRALVRRAAPTLAKTDRRDKLAITQDHWTHGAATAARSRAPGGTAARSAQPALGVARGARGAARSSTRSRTDPRPTSLRASSTSGRWRSTSTRAPAATPASSPARPRTTSRSSARSRSRAGREMHWIRIDRYFTGSESTSPQVVIQPVPCMHCENAPCEYVCPVNATVHSDEGLNEMVYNRCIGTRYCSNNCPYKVRRFNFLDYTEQCTDARAMGSEPRRHGAQPRRHGEVHLLRAAHRAQRIDARVERRAISPTASSRPPASRPARREAIVFGSLNDKANEVSRCTPTRAPTICCTSSARARARRTWRACGTPTPSSDVWPAHWARGRARVTAAPHTRHARDARGQRGCPPCRGLRSSHRQDPIERSP